MSDELDLDELTSRVANISLQFDSALTEGYGATLRATRRMLAAKDESGKRRLDSIKTAADAMRDARPEVPDEHVEEWDEIVETLTEAVDDE